MRPLPDPPAFQTITTARLALRRFRESDLAPFMAYRNDPEVARFQGWAVPLSEADALNFLAESGPGPLAPALGGGQVAIELAATGELVGDLYLGPYGGDPHQGTLGYSLARQHQGRGYATEAARALLGYAFERLGLHRMVATVDTRNGPSVALLERLGMRREGHFLQCYYDPAAGAWTDEYLYALLRAEWPAAEGGAHAQV